MNITPIDLNLPPMLPGYRRCEVCSMEMPKNVYNRQYCTVRCRKRAENARRKQRDEVLHNAQDLQQVLAKEPALQARLNMTEEQLAALCAYAKANPKEIQQIPGRPPEGWMPPEGFTMVTNPLFTVLLYDPAEAEVEPRPLTEVQKIVQSGTERIAEMLKRHQ